ncbi:CRISPR-associated DxTHG motif protein [Myxococcota bacterium]|nr:CRISPR-associated DxTHG motif protein [Myxococcota bacterium]
MTTRLVTFLGKPHNGSYSPVRHQRAGITGPDTCFAAVSLAHFLELGANDEVRALATEAAWQVPDASGQPHGARLTAALAEHGRPVPPTPDPFLEPGEQESHYWQHFQVLRAALAPGATTSRIVLDLTHSFRVHPLLAAAVLSYQRALEPRKADIEVVYAAFETVPKGAPVPLWDLTPLVELADWTWMLTLFLRTGRAEDAARTVQALGRTQRADWARGDRAGPPPSLERLGKALEEFGGALTTVRTGALLHGPHGKAAGLVRSLEAARTEVEQAFPPLAAMLTRVEDMVRPLPCDDLASPEGHRSVAALARLYLDLGRHLEAMATVREGWINQYAPPEAIRPGGTLLGAGVRENAAKDRWFVAQPETAPSVTGKRNDLLHAGYTGGGSMSAERVATAVRQEVDRLHSSVPAATFLNISNHPSAGWTETQLQAARGLAPEVMDLPFPDVLPSASLAQVEALAEELVAKVPAHVRVAMVAGESVLSFAVIARLQAREVRCVAATSMRQVETEADGTRRSRFDFVGFRDYPTLTLGGT